jgi:hypothetical protein
VVLPLTTDHSGETAMLRESSLTGTPVVLTSEARWYYPPTTDHSAEITTLEKRSLTGTSVILTGEAR